MLSKEESVPEAINNRHGNIFSPDGQGLVQSYENQWCILMSFARLFTKTGSKAVAS